MGSGNGREWERRKLSLLICVSVWQVQTGRCCDKCVCVRVSVVAQGGVLSLVPGCSATVSAGNGQVSGTLAARGFPSAGSPVGATMDLYTASAPADSIGYMPAAAGTQLAYPAGIAVSSAVSALSVVRRRGTPAASAQSTCLFVVCSVQEIISKTETVSSCGISWHTIVNYMRMIWYADSKTVRFNFFTCSNLSLWSIKTLAFVSEVCEWWQLC